MSTDLGISLTGGGARGAYQAGVLLGLSEYTKLDFPSSSLPFKLFSGTSAGALNASFIASSQLSFNEAANKLTQIWSELTPSSIYKTDMYSMGKISASWVRDLSFGSAFKNKIAKELLDCAPLKELIENSIDFMNIENNIQSGKLKGLACTAYNYQTKNTVSFIQTHTSIVNWKRNRRHSEKTEITCSHVLASCSIPIIFPPVKIGQSYFGDGSLRNTAPISPIIHLGADKIILIGVRYKGGPPVIEVDQTFPTVAEIFGTILNGLFFDTTDIDIDRLNNLNQLLNFCHSKEILKHRRKLKFVYIRPSVDITRLAHSLAPKNLPSIVNYLLRGLGEPGDYAEIASYLLFDSSFTKKLVEIGYEDAIKNKHHVRNLLE